MCSLWGLDVQIIDRLDRIRMWAYCSVSTIGKRAASSATQPRYIHFIAAEGPLTSGLDFVSAELLINNLPNDFVAHRDDRIGEMWAARPMFSTSKGTFEFSEVRQLR